jgi:hypothetical protein
MGNRQTGDNSKGKAAAADEKASLVERKPLMEQRRAVQLYDLATHPHRDLLMMALHIRAMPHIQRMVVPANLEKLEVCASFVSVALVYSPPRLRVVAGMARGARRTRARRPWSRSASRGPNAPTRACCRCSRRR